MNRELKGVGFSAVTDLPLMSCASLNSHFDRKVQTMFRKILPMLAFLAFAGTAQAGPITFDFSCDPSLGSDCAGDEGGSITIDYTDNGAFYTYDVSIDNVSTDALVTGFGFDFSPDFMFANMSNFLIERYDGTSFEDVTSNWNVSEGSQSVSAGSSFDGIFLDFIDFDASQTGNINKYAIANFGALDARISFDYTSLLTANGALMRLQRTGDNGEGSLKLVDSTITVPEPSTLALLGLGLFGMGARRLFTRA